MVTPPATKRRLGSRSGSIGDGSSPQTGSGVQGASGKAQSGTNTTAHSSNSGSSGSNSGLGQQNSANSGAQAFTPEQLNQLQAMMAAMLQPILQGQNNS